MMFQFMMQNYIDDVSEHVRIGPPLHFVVKNYNYRYFVQSLYTRHIVDHCLIHLQAIYKR